MLNSATGICDVGADAGFAYRHEPVIGEAAPAGASGVPLNDAVGKLKSAVVLNASSTNNGVYALIRYVAIRNRSS